MIDPQDPFGQMPLPCYGETSSKIQEIANVIVRALGKRPHPKTIKYSINPTIFDPYNALISFGQMPLPYDDEPWFFAKNPYFYPS